MIASTYSIAACDLDREEWGVAVQSKFLAVGALAAWAAPGVGAIATQAWINPRFGPEGLDLLRNGATAETAVKTLLDSDSGRDQRQLGIVDGQGRSASHTGESCPPWAGSRTGPGYAAQGNILVSGATVDGLATTFEETAGQPLADRLLRCLAAAQAAGGDRRGQQAAALLVVRHGAGYGGGDAAVDLRVDDHPTPVGELTRLYGLHQLYFGSTPDDEWVVVDDQMRSEIRQRLTALGYESGDLQADFEYWAGIENLEERVSGIERADPVVLGQLLGAA